MIYEEHPIVAIVIVALLIAVLVGGLVVHKVKMKVLLAGVKEDLMNTYTPEILRMRPLVRPTVADQTDETESEEEPLKEG